MLSLVAQGKTLVHTKPMLFIDDDQTEAVELDLILKKCMGTDGNLSIASADHGQLSFAGLALDFAREPGDLNTQWFQPSGEIIAVLLGQYLSGCHQGHLPPTGDTL